MLYNRLSFPSFSLHPYPTPLHNNQKPVLSPVLLKQPLLSFHPPFLAYFFSSAAASVRAPAPKDRATDVPTRT